MYSSNGFNVCPHCGKPNALNARYCSGCGKQLSVPEEAVVCPKCRKANSPMASYCGGCGAPLKQSAPTKNCPRCGKVLPISENICSCGYKFGVATEPTAKVAAKRPYRGGRAFAIVSLVFVLLFAYIIMAPISLRPKFLSDFDNGIIDSVRTSAINMLYGYSLIGEIISLLKDKTAVSLAVWAIYGMFLVTLLCMFLHLVVNIVRIFTAKRSKHSNVVYLILAILSTIWMGLRAVCFYLIPADSTGFLLSVREVFVVEGLPIGWVAYAFPLYFWVMFLFSVCAKVRPLRESVA